MKKILTLILIGFITTNLSGQIPTAGLIGYWPFNGNANDSTSNGYNGIVTGANLTTDRFGNLNAAYSFGDTTKYITIPDAAPLRLNNTDFSISFWVNQSAVLSNQEAIITKRNTGPQSGYIVNITGTVAPTPGLLNYQVSEGADPKVLSDSIVAINEWHHIVVVYSLGMQRLRIYVDGIKNGEATGIPSPNAATSANMIIGKDGLTGVYPFHGKIDDIAIYNRALSYSEVYTMYNPCNGVDITSGIIAQYDFSGNANDVSGNNHNGTVSSATLTADRFGNANKAYSFNGTTSTITVPDHAALRLSNTDYTISAWVRQNIPVTNNAAIVSKRSGSGQNGYMMNLNGSATTSPGHLNFSVSGGTDPKAVSDTIVSANNWHHVAVAYDLSNEVMLLYLDGNLNGVKSGMPSPNPATTINMNIGSDGAGNPYFLNGKIDDIRIYGRELTACDIDSLYNLPDPVLIGINDILSEDNFQIYPNPAFEYFTISGVQSEKIEIFNSYGQLVKSFAVIRPDMKIFIDDLPAGMYFVNIGDSSSNTNIRKIIKY